MVSRLTKLAGPHLRQRLQMRLNQPLRLGCLLSLSIFALHSQAPPPPTGRITGSVQDSTGKPIGGVVVEINSRPAKSTGLLPGARVNTSATTGADGTFTLAPVPNGTYSLCPHPPSANLLPPCSWTTEPQVVVANGEEAIAPPIKLQPGIDFYVRVNDPHGTRASSEGKIPGASLFLAVQAPNGRMFPIPMTAKDSGGFDHHISVPAGTNFVFKAFSTMFQMTDGIGQSISQQGGRSATINVPPGQAQYQQVINIQ